MSFDTEEEIYRKFADGLVRYATVLVGPDQAHDAVAEAVLGALRGSQLGEASNAKAYLYRAVVWLTYRDDLTPATVARVLDISEGSVKRHLARARAAVRKALDEH